MKNLQEIQKLQNGLKNLQVALSAKTISTNEYCDAYYAISQQIKKLK